MSKKGFTLIELLAVLVILAGITIVSVSSITNLSKKNEDGEELYNTIYMAAETYVYNNYESYRTLDTKEATALVNVVDLINEGYLKNNIENPKDKEKFNSSDYVLVTREQDMTLSFQLIEK